MTTAATIFVTYKLFFALWFGRAEDPAGLLCPSCMGVLTTEIDIAPGRVAASPMGWGVHRLNRLRS
jgi:hypothetical protein